MKRSKKYWQACCIAVIVILVACYTPIMIPKGVFNPMLLGMPYSLWTSFLATVALVVLTYLGSRFHPGVDEKEVES
jgi:hypothetical protein